jgi:RNA polymerase sigma factor (sigma-70 family)
MTAIIKLQNIRLSPVQQQMVEANLRLVTFVAHKFRSCIGKNGIEFEDIESIGRIGLIRAVARFDPDINTSFSSLAVPFIKGEINHYLRDKATIIRTPRDKEALKVDSLDRTILNRETPTTLLELIPDRKEREEPQIDDDLLRAIESLNREDRDILVMTQINGCDRKTTAAWLERSVMYVTRHLESAIASVKAILGEPNLKLPKVKRGRNALPFVVDGIVDYPTKHRCINCNSIFGLRTDRTSQLPQTCSSFCASSLAIEKTSSRSPAWTKQELDFCNSLIGKRNLEDIYLELYVFNKGHYLPFRSKNSVKVKLTRLYKSVKVVNGDLSMRELARQLDIPVDRIRFWVKNGLKSTRTSNGRYKITREALTIFAKTNHYRFYAIDIDKLSKLIDDKKVLKKCELAMPHINRIEVVRTDTKKKYRSLRAASRATKISKAHILNSGWIQPSEYITNTRTKENPIDLSPLKNKTKLLDPKIKHKKRWRFLSPSGVEFETNNLALFARVHGLHRSLLDAVWKGRKQSHAGWRRASNSS